MGCRPCGKNTRTDGLDQYHHCVHPCQLRADQQAQVQAFLCHRVRKVQFEHIQVIGKREKVHISKRHDQVSNVQIDADYFNGKRVLLIDDICTTCATANAFIEQMQKAGADVRMTLFLAKTKSYRRTSTHYQYN